MELSRRNLLRSTGASLVAGATLGGVTSTASAHADVADDYRAADASNYAEGDRSADDVRWVVMHTIEGSYEGAISWFRNPDSDVSAHFVVGEEPGQITQMVHVEDVAWTQGNGPYNDTGVGIEMEGYANRTEFGETLYRQAAEVVRWLCEAYDVPERHPTDDIAPCSAYDGRGGVIGHDQIPSPHDCSEVTDGKVDPGSTWDWDHFMSLVRDDGGGGGGGPNPENVRALAKILTTEAGHYLATDAERRAVGYTVVNRMDERGTDSVEDVWDAYAHGKSPTAESEELARRILSGEADDDTGGATFFYSPRSMPAEGEPTDGYAVGGGLEWVPGLDERHYRPEWGRDNERVYVEGVRPAFFKFFTGAARGSLPSCESGLCVGDAVEVAAGGATARNKPADFGDAVGSYDEGTSGTVVGDGVHSPAATPYLKVRLDDGTTGYVPVADLRAPGADEPCGSVTATRTVEGYLSGWDDADVLAHGMATTGTCQVTLSLSGPAESNRDFDLYVTLDGRTPTTEDFDRAARSENSAETVVLDDGAVDSATTLGILVDSYSGPGNYTLTVEEVGTGRKDDGGRFETDQHVETTADLWIRDGPGLDSERVEVAPAGSHAIVVDGPVEADGYTWWGLHYDDLGAWGWSAGDWLAPASGEAAFSTGERVHTTDYVHARYRPGTESTVLDTRAPWTDGEVVNGPVEEDGYTWWGIHFEDDLWAWVAEPWLDS